MSEVEQTDRTEYRYNISKPQQLHAAQNNPFLSTDLRHPRNLIPKSWFYIHISLTPQRQSTPGTVCPLYSPTAASKRLNSDCAMLCRTAQLHSQTDKRDGAA